MKSLPRIILLLTALTFVALAAQPVAAQMYSNERDGTVVGGNVGYGWTRVTGVVAGEDFDTDSQGAFTGLLRFGFASSDQFMISADAGGWVKTWQERQVKIFFLNATACWFPGGQGFFVRGTLGYGNLDVVFITPGQQINFQQGAFNFGGGVGYELRVSPDLAIGVALDYWYFNVGQFEDLEDVKAKTTAITFQINYYL